MEMLKKKYLIKESRAYNFKQQWSNGKDYSTGRGR
jgi:hypothetical protein